MKKIGVFALLFAIGCGTEPGMISAGTPAESGLISQLSDRGIGTSPKELSAFEDLLDSECFGYRTYHAWVCQDGDWKLDWDVGAVEVWCEVDENGDRIVMQTGDVTDCYHDWATYDCATGKSCGEYGFVCPPKPTGLCGRPDRPEFPGELLLAP